MLDPNGCPEHRGSRCEAAFPCATDAPLGGRRKHPRYVQEGAKPSIQGEVRRESTTNLLEDVGFHAADRRISHHGKAAAFLH